MKLKKMAIMELGTVVILGVIVWLASSTENPATV